MSRELIPQDAALRLQLGAIAGNEPASSFLELRWRRPRGGMGQCFYGCRRAGSLLDLIARVGRQTDVYIGVAPRVRQSGSADAVQRVWALWCDVDDAAALAGAATFRPLPSIVIRSGSGGAHVYWPLSEPIAPEWARRANRRLALVLGGDVRATDAARVLRPAGTLNHKHPPARPVTCTRLELDVFTLREVVGGLPDDPACLPRPPRRQARTRNADAGAELDGLVRTVSDASQGNRNAALYWAACRLAEDGHDVEHGRVQLRDAALSAGLTERETDATLRSALDRRAAA